MSESVYDFGDLFRYDRLRQFLNAMMLCLQFLRLEFTDKRDTKRRPLIIRERLFEMRSNSS